MTEKKLVLGIDASGMKTGAQEAAQAIHTVQVEVKTTGVEVGHLEQIFNEFQRKATQPLGQSIESLAGSVSKFDANIDRIISRMDKAEEEARKWKEEQEKLKDSLEKTKTSLFSVDGITERVTQKFAGLGKAAIGFVGADLAAKVFGFTSAMDLLGKATGFVAEEIRDFIGLDTEATLKKQADAASAAAAAWTSLYQSIDRAIAAGKSPTEERIVIEPFTPRYRTPSGLNQVGLSKIDPADFSVDTGGLSSGSGAIAKGLIDEFKSYVDRISNGKLGSDYTFTSNAQILEDFNRRGRELVEAIEALRNADMRAAGSFSFLPPNYREFEDTSNLDVIYPGGGPRAFGYPDPNRRPFYGSGDTLPLVGGMPDGMGTGVFEEMIRNLRRQSIVGSRTSNQFLDPTAQFYNASLNTPSSGLTYADISERERAEEQRRLDRELPRIQRGYDEQERRRNILTGDGYSGFTFGDNEQTAGLSRQLGQDVAASFGEGVMTNDWKSAGKSVIQSLQGSLLQELALEPFADAATGFIQSFLSSFSGLQIGGTGTNGAAALGLAFNNGGSIIPMAYGGVFNGPQIVGGRGGQRYLVGEAGDEAAMPLTRTRDGHLGVRAVGGGRAGNITINVSGGGDPQRIGRSVRQALHDLKRM